MKEIQNLLKKYVGLISGVCISVYLLYLAFLVFKELDQAKTLSSFFGKVWTYQIYSSGSVTLTLNKIVLGVVIVSLGVICARYLANKMLHRLLQKTPLSRSSRATIENLIFYFICLLFVIIALNIIQVPLTIFTVFGGALAIGVGFGSQDLIKNFMSGMILQLEKPMKIGDIIEIDADTKGVVQEIGTRSTKILMSDNSHAILPNSVFLEKKFINQTLQDEEVRCRINVTLSYKNNPQEVIKISREVLEKVPGVLKYKDLKLIVTDFGDFGIKYAFFFFVDLSSEDKTLMETRARMALYEAYQKNNIKFATNPAQLD